MRPTRRIGPLAMLLPLVLSTALATGCAANKRPPARARATRSVPPALTPLNYPKYTNFDSAAGAVAELARVFKPDMIGFGEFHNEVGGDFKSSSQRFGEEIAPILKEKGFGHLIVEFAPDNDKTAVEFTRLRLSGKPDPKTMPTVFKWARGTDEKGILSIYQNAAQMNIYGGNVQRPKDDKAPVIRPNKFSIIIKKTVMTIADAVLGDGEKVVSYTGIYHNDIKPDASNREISFGPYFSQRYSYLEIDLIVPEMMGGYPMGGKEIEHYRPLIPSSGVMLYRESEHKFVMIFARTT